MSFSLMTAAAIAAVTAANTTLAASSWHFDVQSDPLGQNVYVAEATGSEDLPQAFLRFSCGGMPGVLLQLNLGQALQDGGDFRADDPAWEDVTFVFPEGEYAAATKRAAIADGIGTFEIKGSEAMFIARQFKAGGELIVRQSVHSARFMLDEAAGPISEVIASCPFKYEDQ
jgi:hypothetical protein